MLAGRAGTDSAQQLPQPPAREVLSRALADIDEANGVVRLSMVMGPVVKGPRGW
jgi:hypothetical protein